MSGVIQDLKEVSLSKKAAKVYTNTQMYTHTRERERVPTSCNIFIYCPCPVTYTFCTSQWMSLHYCLAYFHSLGLSNASVTQGIPCLLSHTRVLHLQSGKRKWQLESYHFSHPAGGSLSLFSVAFTALEAQGVSSRAKGQGHWRQRLY